MRARHGARVRVWDSRENPPQARSAGRSGGRTTPSCTARWRAQSLVDAELVLKSPGLAPRDERIASLLDHAKSIGIAVQGELDLFARALADLKAGRGYAPQLLAVTGTNGKTTTTSLTAKLVERAGRAWRLAGNIGPTLLDTLAQALDDEAVLGHLPEVWVLELSSFQLDGVQGFEPDAAAVLNLTQDHLDWHGTMEHYAAAKARIFGASATIVVNRDDARVLALLPTPPEAEVRPRRAGRSRCRAASCASAPTRRVNQATTASSSRTAWRGWCAPTRPTKARAAAAAPRPRPTTSCTCSA